MKKGVDIFRVIPIINPMSNELHDLSQVSCEEIFTEDMGQADWANEGREQEEIDAAFDNFDKLAAKVLKAIDQLEDLEHPFIMLCQ